MSAHTMAEAIEIIREPFHVGEVEWRIQSSGEKGDKVWAIVVPYTTARSVHDRLDEAFGATGWYNEFRGLEVPGGVSGIICRLNYLDPETDEWRFKENGAGQTHIEPFKGGLSDSEKRAFEQLGGGRYLYSLDTQFAETAKSRSDRCPEYAKTKGGVVFYWGYPLLPTHAIPRVKIEVGQQAEDIMGAPIDDRIEYPVFDRVIASMAKKHGVAELKGARLNAREMGWSDDMLLEFAVAIGVDLFNGLAKSGCIKLRDMILQEKKGS